MKDIEIIRTSIKRIPRGKVILTASLSGIASPANIRQVLSRMVKSGEIERVARGVFFRPKKTPYLRKAFPTSEEISESIAKISGEVIVPHGAEAARRLNLTTQVPVQPIFYTSGNTRRIKIGSYEIILKHISPRKLVKPGSTVGLVISALWYLGKSNVNKAIIDKIKKQLKSKQFVDLCNQTHLMPIWMANLFYRYKKEHFSKNYGQ